MIGVFKKERQKLHRIPASDMRYLTCRYFMCENEIGPIVIALTFQSDRNIDVTIHGLTE